MPSNRGSLFDPFFFFFLGMHATMPVWNTEQGGTVTINYQSPEENALSPMGPLLGENSVSKPVSPACIHANRPTITLHTAHS